MPDVSFHNNLNQSIHIGIWIGWLDHYGNSIASGASWTVHLASILLTIEIRIDTGSNGFSKAEGDAKVGEMLGAIGQGTISVLSGLGWGLGIMGIGGRPGQVACTTLRDRAWKASSDTMQNAIQGGARYFSNDGAGHIMSTRQIIVLQLSPFHYEVRAVDNRIQLYDPSTSSVRAEATPPAAHT
ncbi:hypothetical protein PENSPDRAFT_653407 [Peniophora sp. CONT]|nr:hypothetical protein PENSPDRAFT_653407 [Peniophora sp. CONT]